MKNLGLVSLLLSTLLLLTSCGSDDSSTSSSTTTVSSQATTVSGLPKSTGPVVSSSGSLRASIVASKLIESSTQNVASTGETFSTATSTAWTSGHSRSFCESVSMTKDLLAEAAQPDAILCYLGSMESAGMYTAPATGTYAYGILTNMEDSETNTAPRVKYRIDKNSSGEIIFFEMFMCFGGTASSPVQDGYVSQTINSDGTISVVAKNSGTGTQGGGTYSYSGNVTVSGSLNSARQWTSKTINATRKYTMSGGGYSDDFGSNATLTQTSGTITLNGYTTGSRGGSGYSETFSNRFNSVYEILNSSSMNTFAIGDGSSLFDISFSRTATGQSTINDNFTNKVESWNGDTRAVLSSAADGTHYTTAVGGTLPTISSISAITYSSSETWDCLDANGGTSGFTTLDFSTSAGQTAAAGIATCSTQFEGNRQWIECYNTASPQ